MKKLIKVLAVIFAVATAGAAAYYYFVMRQKKPQVELYFDDGSMLAFPGNTPEAAEFMNVAKDVLDNSPVAGSC